MMHDNAIFDFVYISIAKNSAVGKTPLMTFIKVQLTSWSALFSSPSLYEILQGLSLGFLPPCPSFQDPLLRALIS